MKQAEIQPVSDFGVSLNTKCFFQDLHGGGTATRFEGARCSFGEEILIRRERS